MSCKASYVLLALAVLPACTSARTEGVTSGAGNAIAANTVMQMVDPWPVGVENTDLDVPADHSQYRPAAAASEEGGDGESDSGSDK
jgi:hypothetical protein